MASWSPSVAGDSHEGVRGKKNEDSWAYFAIDPIQGAGQSADKTHILIVADGVTGQAGGEQASKIAIEAMQRHLNKPNNQSLPTRLEDALALANQEILNKAQENPDWGRMSTTVVLAALVGDRLYIAHVGDSRAYLVRDGVAFLLTLDHTWVQEAIDGNRLSQEDAKTHPNRHTILRYLGINRRVESDLQMLIPGQKDQRTSTPLALLPGDAILVCSDGLSDKVRAQEFAEIVTKHSRNPKTAVQKMIGQALQRQEADNITAVLAALPAENSGMFGAAKGWFANRLLVTILIILVISVFALTLRGFGGGSLSTTGGSVQEVATINREGNPATQTTVGGANPPSVAAVPNPTATGTDTSTPIPMEEGSSMNDPAATPTPTDTAPPISTFTPTPIVDQSGTPDSASAALGVTVTSTRVPPATPTATNTATATSRPGPVNTPIQLRTPTSLVASTAPDLDNIQVKLIAPVDGFNVPDRVTFQWQISPPATTLPAELCYEVQLRPKGLASGLDPFGGFGVGGSTRGTQVEDNLQSNTLVSSNTDYEWAVFLVNCPPNYNSIKVISEVRVLKSPGSAPNRKQP